MIGSVRRRCPGWCCSCAVGRFSSSTLIGSQFGALRRNWRRGRLHRFPDLVGIHSHGYFLRRTPSLGSLFQRLRYLNWRQFVPIFLVKKRIWLFFKPCFDAWDSIASSTSL